MKNYSYIAVIVLIIVVGFFFFDNGNVEIINNDSLGVDIIAFGDSLVEGVGANSGNNFVSVLSERIDEKIINEGVSGNTTSQGLLRLDDTLKKYNPKIIILLLGGNDTLQKISIDETFSNLTQIITKIQDKGSAVILVGVQSGVFRDKYKKEYKKLSEELGTGYVPDILDDLIGDSIFMSDPIHPNDAGYKIMADRIEPVLRDLLEL